MTGTDAGGGYLQLSDNSRLRAEAKSLIQISDDDAFELLRRASAMGQESVKTAILERLQQPDCSARPSHHSGPSSEEEPVQETAVQEQEQEHQEERHQSSGSALGWWTKDHEIAMCHEFIDVLMRARETTSKQGTDE